MKQNEGYTIIGGHPLLIPEKKEVYVGKFPKVRGRSIINTGYTEWDYGYLISVDDYGQSCIVLNNGKIEYHEIYEFYEWNDNGTKEIVPFSFEDAEFLIGKMVKDGNRIFMITGVDNKYVYSGDSAWRYIDLVNITFLDGSPCGKVEK